MGYVAPIMTAVGTVASIYGQAQQSKAQKNAATYDAQQQTYQAQTARQNAAVQAQMSGISARDAMARGLQEAEQHETTVQQLWGEQRATLAASGVMVDQGSAADIQRDTLAMGARDALTIRSNAAREAWGHQMNQSMELAGGEAAYQSRMQAAALSRLQGKQAAQAGALGIATSVLTGGSDIADKWYRWDPAVNPKNMIVKKR